MKKIIYTIGLGVLAMFLLHACQQDPVFPDPGFEIGDQRVEVRRDTADYYKIKMKMNVPNGVKVIEILNATNFKLIDQVHSYDGQKSFDFIYQIDLRSFDKDTVLNYIVKVTDNDMRSFNQGIRISVRRKSFPEIFLVGGTNLAVAAPSYYVKGLVSCGLNNISSIKILYEGKEQYSFTATTAIKEMPLKKIVLLGNMQPGVNYKIDIIISDDKGQQSTTTITVRKGGEIKKPRRIIYRRIDSSIINMDFTYNPAGNITALDYVFASGTIYRHEFQYNALNMVEKLTYLYYNLGVFTTKMEVFYNYVPGTKQLSTIEKKTTSYASGVVTEYPKTVDYKNFVYGANNTVTSFFKTQMVNNIRYSDPFGLGEQVFGEYWQTMSYQVTDGLRRQHRSEYDPILMPTYIEGFPPFAEGGGSLLPIFNDFLWSKYVMISTVNTSPLYTSTYLEQPSYTYETDNEGILSSITKTFKGGQSGTLGKSETYTFIYD